MASESVSSIHDDEMALLNSHIPDQMDVVKSTNDLLRSHNRSSQLNLIHDIPQWEPKPKKVEEGSNYADQGCEPQIQPYIEQLRRFEERDRLQQELDQLERDEQAEMRQEGVHAEEGVPRCDAEETDSTVTPLQRPGDFLNNVLLHEFESDIEEEEPNHELIRATAKNLEDLEAYKAMIEQEENDFLDSKKIGSSKKGGQFKFNGFDKIMREKADKLPEVPQDWRVVQHTKADCGLLDLVKEYQAIASRLDNQEKIETEFLTNPQFMPPGTADEDNMNRKVKDEIDDELQRLFNSHKKKFLREKGDLDWVYYSKRIKKGKAHMEPRMQQMWRVAYQLQEQARYENPTKSWLYYNPDGSTTIVGPAIKKEQQSSGKPRDHKVLKRQRPPSVTLLNLCRDAVARLPYGIGTRAEICDLLKESQYLESNFESSISNIVSGTLDRLHYEQNPCLKYDSNKRIWIYLLKDQILKDKLQESNQCYLPVEFYNAYPPKFVVSQMASHQQPQIPEPPCTPERKQSEGHNDTSPLDVRGSEQFVTPSSVVTGGSPEIKVHQEGNLIKIQK